MAKEDPKTPKGPGRSRKPSTPRATLPTDVKEHVDKMGYASLALDDSERSIAAAHELYNAYLPVEVDKDPAMAAMLYAAEEGRKQLDVIDRYRATPEADRGDKPTYAPTFVNTHTNVMAAQMVYDDKRTDMLGEMTGKQLALLYMEGDSDLNFEVPESVAAAIRSAGGKLKDLDGDSSAVSAIGVLDRHRIHTRNSGGVEAYIARRDMAEIAKGLEGAAESA